MIINPSVKLNNLDVSQVWAKLERVDGKGSYNFLVNPEEVVWSHQADFSTLPVLYTAQPLVRYKSSVSSLSLPKVLFWTPAHSGDLTAILVSLKAMTKPPQPGQELPILKLTWGNLVEPRLHLKSFSYREKQWRSGRVTSAEGNMEFLLAPEPSKAQYSKVPVAKNKPASSSSTSASQPTKLTDREREEYKAKILTKLASDKALKVKYNYKTIKEVTVDADGMVKVVCDGGLNIFGGQLDTFVSLQASHKGLFK